MSEPIWKSPCDIEVTEVLLLGSPRAAVLRLVGGGSTLTLHLDNPQPMAVLHAAFNWWQIRVLDVKPVTQQEFGRYSVEFLDEDGYMASVSCDAYEIEDMTRHA